MCEKAKEIQELRPIGEFNQDGDYFSINYHGSYEINIDHDPYGPGRRGNLEIWLPRQDQLQEMLNRTIWHLQQSFHHWFLELVIPLISAYDDRTMEQLWLAFVMETKYGKVWNGQEWVKEVCK
jgi:hypothetical protein